MSTEGKGAGKTYEMGRALHFKIGGGKVTCLRCCDDTGAITEALR